ncbi:hypothetical protein RDI58_006618 [Solanum bulbocastanum]
MIEFY